MAVITERQRIAKRAAFKRQKINNFKPTNKSADFNSGFMSHFSQKPVRKAKKHQSSIFKPLFKGFKTEKRKDKKYEPKIKRHKEENDRKTGFTFPVPSLGAFAAAAGVVVIALAAFNWEEINIPSFADFTYQPGEDTEAEKQTMLYAATGITGFFHTPDVKNEVKNMDIIDPPVINDAENAQNDLITFEWQQYRVRKGESVSVIAQKFGISIGAVIASNDIKNARALREGDILRIPNVDGIPYQIKNGDSLVKIAASYNLPLEVILDINDIKNDNIITGETIFLPGARMNDIDLRMSLGELFMYPVPSRYITSPYGMRIDPIGGHWAFHTGIDLRANTGTSVVASLDGRVSLVSENRIYGKYIIVTHDNGYKTLYAHLNSYSVKQGDRVARGRKIAESGNTGYSTGPHLHFSIYDRNNKLVNPLELLR